MSKKITMKLLKLEIRGLFDLFDYDIPLTNPENLTIITGPNGFGKTMILNIIDSLFNKNFLFFEKLIFNEIIFLFDEEYQININRKDEDKTLKFIVLYKNEVVTQFEYLDKNEYQNRLNTIKKRIDINRFSTNELLEKRLQNEEYFQLILLINSINVHLIKEQRLLQKKEIDNNNPFFSDESDFSFFETIQENANELSILIKQTIDESFKVTQRLDSSFPKRLLEATEGLNETDFKTRFEQLKLKQEKLKNLGLTESLQEVPETFNQENAKVLLMYLNDSEIKSSVFDDLLDRLELFTNILNNRRFTYKSIKIDKEKGFFFITSQDKPLNLTELSSGEQHEVILLYELIFKAKANTLVLIDEPEISLHVSWQKEFLNDLIKIIDLQKIQVIIATHSPQIINNRWDLTVDLEKIDE